MRKFALCCLLLLCTAYAVDASHRPMHKPRHPQRHPQRPRLDGRSLLDCINRLNYTYLLRAIEAAGLTALFRDPKTQLTFFAPDNAAWLEIAKEAGTTFEQLLQKPELLKKALSYHMCIQPLPPLTTEAWPLYTNPAVKNYIECTTLLPNPVASLPNLKLQLFRDADQDPNVAGSFPKDDASLNCVGRNMHCGRSVMHGIDEVLFPLEP